MLSEDHPQRHYFDDGHGGDEDGQEGQSRLG
jgi:hypothetical protein